MVFKKGHKQFGHCPKGFKRSEGFKELKREQMMKWWEKNRNTEEGQRLIKQGKKNLNKGSECGEKAHNWKGGQTTHMEYIYVKTDKPLPKWNGYVKRANLVWFENTGEVIKKPYLIHHINGEKTDDRFENLQKMKIWEHIAMEGLKNKRNKEGKFIINKQKKENASNNTIHHNKKSNECKLTRISKTFP